MRLLSIFADSSLALSASTAKPMLRSLTISSYSASRLASVRVLLSAKDLHAGVAQAIRPSLNLGRQPAATTTRRGTVLAPLRQLLPSRCRCKGDCIHHGTQNRAPAGFICTRSASERAQENRK